MSDSHTGLTHSSETRAKMSGANNPMYGKTHTPETRAQMSYSKSEALNPMYGKVLANAFQSGYAANHPMYGKVAANAMTINVYSVVDNKLVHSFTSQVAAA